MPGIGRCGSKTRPGMIPLRQGVLIRVRGMRIGRQAGEPGRAAMRWRAIRMPAEVDVANAREAREALLAAIGEGWAIVVADLGDTSFCDCAGVAALMSACLYAAEAGAQLRVVARTRAVLRTLELTGITQVMPVYPDLAAALGGTPATPVTPGAVPSAVRLRSRRRTDHG